MSHPIVHFEIGCRDKAKTAEFFSKLFDWKIEDEGSAARLRTGEDVGGHITALGHEPHNYVTVYFAVDDIPAYLDKVVALGGRKVVGPIDIPGGSFAWFNDPEGNLLGLYRGKS